VVGLGTIEPEAPWVYDGPPPPELVPPVPTALPTASAVTPPTPQAGWWGGDKYDGGYGATQLYDMDYWTLRARSSQLFRDNLYARGLVRRLVTNEINVGLTLESIPDEQILGVPDDSLTDWSEETENRFTLWAKSPELCDYEGRRTFGAIQRAARLEALVSGDVLVILDQARSTSLPRVRLVNGSKVQTPLNDDGRRGTNEIEHGVERDARGRHVAYWIQAADGTEQRVPAFGSRSKRRIAWLVYGTDKRLDDVRGEPLLSLILQSLKEVDRYRDAALRKAVINSILAMFVEKGEDKMGTLPVTGGSIRKGEVTPVDSTNTVRRFKIAEQVPGMVIEELQQGEKPVPHSTAGTDVNFGPFEESIIQAISWACEIPPEILTLAFSNNYSASQAAINEFKIYLNMVRTRLGEEFLQPIYVEWLVSQVLTQRIEAVGFLDAWRDPQRYDKLGAWVAADWCGAIKPSTDMLKQAKAHELLLSMGAITHDRSSRELTGTKFSKNVKRLRRENELLAAAQEPLQPVDIDTAVPPAAVGIAS